MKEIILQKLQELEQRKNIKILYACESGSRAWGFASPDSDFDVRFLYEHNLDYYLSIADSDDVLNLPVNEVLDIGGWDLKKALKLFLRSNAALYEWLQSPIVYSQETAFAEELRELMPRYFSLKAGAHHYLAMALNTLRDDLQAEQVKLKRYFYALRPALACLWIVERQSVPPMEFDKLRVLITDDTVHQGIDDLLERKQRVDEKAFIAPVAVLNKWLSEVLGFCNQQVPLLPSMKKRTDELDGIFRKYIQS